MKGNFTSTKWKFTCVENGNLQVENILQIENGNFASEKCNFDK